jgi:hypothetical protein
VSSSIHLASRAPSINADRRDIFRARHVNTSLQPPQLAVARNVVIACARRTNSDRRSTFHAAFPYFAPVQPSVPNPIAAIAAAVSAIPLALDTHTHAQQRLTASSIIAAVEAQTTDTAVSTRSARSRKAVVAHPTGNYFQAMPLPLHAGPLAILQATQANISSFMCESVIESSRKTYESGYKHFCKFAQLIGTDRFLQTVPADFYNLPQPQPLSWFLLAMLGFITYLRLNISVTPGTVSTYCSGVRYFLINSGVDVSEMDNSQVMKSVRTGMHKSWRAMPGNAKSETDTLPISADMIVRTRNELCSSANPERQSRLQLALATAIVFAFILLARISEYIVTKSNHHIRGKHVTFVLASGALILSSQAHLHSVGDIHEMYVTIKDSKNDADGMGHRFTYSKLADGSRGLFCIVSEMFRCASVLRPAPDTAFFAWQGSITESAWSLSEHSLNSLLKKGAALFGFDIVKIHSHSLRIGGASALAAAGAPSWVIQLTGRWKSLAFLQYIRLASTAFQRSFELQTDGTTFTADHIKQWSPALRADDNIIT